MSQSMMAEGSGVSARPSGSWGLGLGASGVATRSGAAAIGAGGRGVAAGAVALISGVIGFSGLTGLSRLIGFSRGTAARGLDAAGRAGIAACASIGAALPGACRSGSAARSASPDGTGLDGASARGRVTTAVAGGPSPRAGASGGRDASSEAVRAELSLRPASHHAR
jgi:hypothetical protein